MVQKQTFFIVFVLSLVLVLTFSQHLIDTYEDTSCRSVEYFSEGAAYAPVCVHTATVSCVHTLSTPALTYSTLQVSTPCVAVSPHGGHTLTAAVSSAMVGSYGGGSVATYQSTVAGRRSATVNLPQMQSTVAAQKPVYTAPAKAGDMLRMQRQRMRDATVIQPLSLGYASASQYISAAPAVHRAPGNGVDNALNNWLIYGSGSGALVSGDASTGYYYDMAKLQELFNQMQANGDMPGMTWEQFLDWFNNGSQNRHFAPVGDACWMLALLALGYGVFVQRKHKRQTMITE